MTGKAKHIWLIWTAIIIGVLAYVTQPFIPHFKMFGIDRSAYYIGVAASIFCMALFIVLNFSNAVTFTLLALAINNLADEVVFQPLKFGVNEIALVVTLIIGWYAYTKIKEYESYE